MLASISLFLFVLAGVGLCLLVSQVFAVRVYQRRTRYAAARLPPISILKPLCGVDDDLESNLKHFANLDYPDYELLLGVPSREDPAYSVARACEQRHPGRVRVVLQRGRPGYNPKVNQLVTLEQAAHHEIVVVSDSNVRVRPGYLQEIAAGLEDPTVGLVTHPISGRGEKRLGSLFDNLHLLTHCAPGVIAAKLLAGRDLVVGKSMAMRRTDIARLGGFESVKDVLAEDYVLGVAIGEQLGLRILLGDPIENVSEHRSIGHFVSRYQRWSVMQRKLVGLPLYCAQLLLNPIAIAAAALLLSPSTQALLMFACICLMRTGLGLVQAHLIRGELPLLSILALPLKDLVVGWAWLVGLTRSSVEWRGKRFVVLGGSRILPTVHPVATQLPSTATRVRVAS